VLPEPGAQVTEGEKYAGLLLDAVLREAFES